VLKQKATPGQIPFNGSFHQDKFPSLLWH